MKSKSTAKGVGDSAVHRRVMQLADGASNISQAIDLISERVSDGVVGPPTDLEELCSRLGVWKCGSADIPVNGELHKSSKGFEIRYSNLLTAVRQRFTIAHELGHVILESTGARCPRSGEEVERICDQFAASLLMPKPQFIDCIESDAVPNSIVTASNRFAVSATSAAIRYVSLFNANAFEVYDGRVTWSSGLLRNSNSSSEIRPLIEASMKGEAGDQVVCLNYGRTRLRLCWVPTGRARALFVGTAE